MYNQSLKTELKRQLQEHLKEKSAILIVNRKKLKEEDLMKLDKLEFKIQYIEDQLKYF